MAPAYVLSQNVSRRVDSRRRGGVLEWTTSELALFLEGSELVGRVALSPPAWTPDERRVTFV
jgi:hypothetical protein